MNDQDPPGAKPDPFAAFESERTIIKPSAGRTARTGDGPTVTGAAAQAPAATGWQTPGNGPSGKGYDGTDLPAYASLNPLVQAAAPLLAAAPRLRATLQHNNPAALRDALGESIRRFEAGARAQGLPNEQVVAARYVLCTLLDEAASSTPWGGSGAWAAQSLLVQFHNEGWGGEKVFQLLTRLAESPAKNRNLLELLYAALSLGFEGRYRVLDNGRAQLDDLRKRLAQMLRDLSEPVDKTLSTQWKGLAAPVARLRDGFPVWVMAVASALLLALVFMALRLTLNAQTDTTFSALMSLDAQAAKAPPPPVPATPPPPIPPRLAKLLQEDIKASKLQVVDLVDRSMVTVLGDSLFDPGSADVARRALPLFQHVAEALNQVPGQVMVSGHTDSQPIRTLRFPSNWHLSKERAESVRQLLAASVTPSRLEAEGRAETEPVADNNTAESRARNRRVEITLIPTSPN